jgi:hypothetical protein
MILLRYSVDPNVTDAFLKIPVVSWIATTSVNRSHQIQDYQYPMPDIRYLLISYVDEMFCFLCTKRRRHGCPICWITLSPPDPDSFIKQKLLPDMPQSRKRNNWYLFLASN